MPQSNQELPDIGKFLSTTSNSFWAVTCSDPSPDDRYSDSIKNVTGYTSEEIKNFPAGYFTLIHEEDLETVKRKLAILQNESNDKTSEFSYRIKTKDGKIVWVKEYITPASNNGSSKVYFNRLIINISDIKRNEQKLMELRDYLTKINAEKDKFISIVSHDLKSPFTTLLGFSEILLNENDLPEQEKTEYLHYIYDASKTQLQLINCLLDWSRLQTGRIKVEPARMNVKGIVSTCISSLTHDAIDKKIEIKSNIPDDLFISADERLTNQAITNLISNAIKFTPEGKKVYVTVNKFKEGMVEIVVKDEGLGIAEEHHSKLFKIDEKFTLVGTKGEKGSGFGLTLVKEIIERQGGDVWFYSRVDEGSEFHITIPEAKNTVLLVEDDLAVRALYKKIMEQALSKFEVIQADNGYQALKLIMNEKPSLVITDHDMPLMNGIQLVEAFRSKETTRGVPFIVVSAKLTDDITSKYKKLGVDKVIKKPVNFDELVDLIRECIY